MKLLFDQNLSYRLVARVDSLFPGSAHVASLGLDRSSDLEIWHYAKAYDFVVVSKDYDFNDLSAYYGFPPYLLWLRTGNASVESIAKSILAHATLIYSGFGTQETGIIEIQR